MSLDKSEIFDAVLGGEIGLPDGVVLHESGDAPDGGRSICIPLADSIEDGNRLTTNDAMMARILLEKPTEYDGYDEWRDENIRQRLSLKGQSGVGMFVRHPLYGPSINVSDVPPERWAALRDQYKVAHQIAQSLGKIAFLEVAEMMRGEREWPDIVAEGHQA